MQPFGIDAETVTKLFLSPDVNGVPTDMRKVPDTLARFCRPLLFHHNDPHFDMGYSGSSLLFRYRDRNFQLACEHQLRVRNQPDLDPATSFLVFRRDGKPVGLSPIEVSRPRFGVDDDKTVDDLLLLSFDDVRDGHALTPHFWQLDLDHIATLSDVPPQDVKLIFATGYPTSAADYEPTFDDDGNFISLNVVNRWAKLYLEPRPHGPLDVRHRVSLLVVERQHGNIGDPDGWSGSPVFFFWRSPGSAVQIGFAGMVTTANLDGRFALYPAATIRGVVNGFLNTSGVEGG